MIEVKSERDPEHIDESHDESSTLEIPCGKAMWLSPPLHYFLAYFEASQAHQNKKSSLAHILLIMPHIAKLERVYNCKPWVVLYEMYYVHYCSINFELFFQFRRGYSITRN